MFVGFAFLYQIQKDETIFWSVNEEEMDIFIYFVKAVKCQIGKDNWDLEINLQEKFKKSKSNDFGESKMAC